MTTSKSYLTQQKYQNATFILKQHPEQMKNFNKIATLEPYLADIEKRQKMKSKLSKHSKNKLNQSSSRSFRIKDVSTSSLHKLTFDRVDLKTNKLQKNKETINTTGALVHPRKIKPTNETLIRQKKAKSQQYRPFQSSLSKTINTKQAVNTIKDPKDPIIKLDKDKQSTQKINAFNDYFLRMNRTKDNKPKFRKNLYEIALPKKNSITEDTKPYDSIKKISCTEINIQKKSQNQRSQEQIQMNRKKTQILRKNNFRRGKYEAALHSSVNEKPQNDNSEPLQSQRLYQLHKKQSNLTINQEMDILAQNQMQKFYRQIRTKEIQKSLEKSTQKYFGNDSYRPVKSKNEIQLYVSSIINPSLNKISQSTYDKSDHHNKSPLDTKNRGDFYAYNFDFEPEKNPVTQKICEMENPSQQEQSLSNLKEQDFERQRRNAEIQYFHKDHHHIEWSDDDCQVDDI